MAKFVNTLSDVVYRITAQIVNDVLGSVPANEDVRKDWHQDKITDAQRELENQDLPATPIDADKLEKQGKTVFYCDENGIYIKNHQFKGFLKEAGESLRRRSQDLLDEEAAEAGPEEPKKKGKKGSIWSGIRNKVSAYIEIQPVKIYLKRDGKFIKVPDEVMVRPLRAETKQGPRTALSASEYLSVEKGELTFSCDIRVLEGAPISEKMIHDMLSYALHHGGLLQWRNAGHGHFEVIDIEVQKAA